MVTRSRAPGTYFEIADFPMSKVQAFGLACCGTSIMESTLVRRDQFVITPQGIVHKPTDAAFTANPGDPVSGIERLGQLGNKHPNGKSFRTDDVRRMMRELWSEYVASNPQ